MRYGARDHRGVGTQTGATAQREQVREIERGIRRLQTTTRPQVPVACFEDVPHYNR